MAANFKAGDKVKSKYTDIEYVIIRPTDRGTNGIHQFFEVRPVKGGIVTNFSLKEIESA